MPAIMIPIMDGSVQGYMFRYTVIILIFAGLTFLWSGCGKKAPPVHRYQDSDTVQMPLEYNIHG